MLTKRQVEVCPLCEGTGWKTLPARSSAPKDRRVTRCDCQLRARNQTLLKAARIPKRYEKCELGNFEFDGANRSLTIARMAACKFVEDYPIDKVGLMLVGKAGRGKTHLAVGIAKALIREKGIECTFYDYAELLKEIQDSYNPSVAATELGLLRPVFETEVLVVDDLGSVRPTEWRWDTIRLILNTRYNEGLTTVITTNFADEPALHADDPDAVVSESFATARAAAREDTLGDRIGERMRSRLHEMCQVITLEGHDYRETMRNASGVTVACADCPACGKENVYRRIGSLRRPINSTVSLPITCKNCSEVFHISKNKLQVRKKPWKELDAEYGVGSLEWM